MKQVEVSSTFAVRREDIEERLTPRSIIEYQETFEIQSIEETSSGWNITAINEEAGVRSVVDVTETESGYVYEQKEGVFDEQYTEITISENDRTEVTVRSSFTFGGVFAFYWDRLAREPRRHELERLMSNLTVEIEPDATDSTESEGAPEDG